MKVLLEEWREYLDEGKEGPFKVHKTDQKIRGRAHFVVKHLPSDKIIPSAMVKVGRKNASALANLLNDANIEGIEDSELSEDTIGQILQIMRNSEFAEDSVEF
tara:strand:- start:612 stop:920 length:309 start_codon:yes stop_codon:yes gene_type:complete